MEIEKKSEFNPDEDDLIVKSTAVVKYAAVETPAKFSELSTDIDLNLPPANWLRESHGWKSLRGIWKTGTCPTTEFSSFHMVNDFPDCVGDVDVISDAENIKKLLKIPYSKSQVSMLVHRIGKTILLDEFDIHHYLLRTEEKEWEWLKKFYLEHVLQSLQLKEKGFPRKNKSRYLLQNKSMLSKFLYYSVADTPHESSSSEDSDETPMYNSHNQSYPEPVVEEKNYHRYSGDHDFLRKILWTFEDITMFIGTDMPIFGGGTHPCVSLRLREKNKPISILTGLDYWLDNLMCNVPEVVMCYHLDGIVQAYELLKTEDIPRQENSKFSPKVIKDVAQNILSFLKANATKAGRTYWLFKGKDDDVVKLYDLTSLCSDITDDNPFAVPVAMLLFRVAQNMLKTNSAYKKSKKRESTVYTLLKNCLKLLDEEKHLQVIISAHCILTDLFIPSDMDPEDPRLSDFSDDDDDDVDNGVEEEEIIVDSTKDPENEQQMRCYHKEEDRAGLMDEKMENFEFSSSVEVKALCVPEKCVRDYSDSWKTEAITISLQERSKMTLEYVAKGFSYLDKPEEKSSYKKENKSVEDEVQKMAKPFEPIPLNYEPLNSSETLEVCNQNPSSKSSSPMIRCSPKSCSKGNNCWRNLSHNGNCPLVRVPWQTTHRLHLLEKGALAAYILAEACYCKELFNEAIQYLKMAIICIECIQGILSALCQNAQDITLLLKCCLALAGDVHYMQLKLMNLSKDSDRSLDSTLNSVESKIITSVEKHLPEETAYQKIWTFGNTVEEKLARSCHCYQEALNYSTCSNTQTKLSRRLGNIHNELGMFFMQEAETCYSKNNLLTEEIEILLKNSAENFKNGLSMFNAVKDLSNIALLLSNLGRLMRVNAHYRSPSTEYGRKEFSMEERQFYKKAISYYDEAVKVLTGQQQFEVILESIKWEHSTTLFITATLLQDYAPLTVYSQEQVESEVSELMLKALKYCNVDPSSPNQPICQYRAAVIHHRLASLFHHALRNQMVENTLKRKERRQLAEKHYTEACQLFKLLDHFADYLRVVLEHVGLNEFFLQNLTGHTSRIKMLNNILSLLMEILPVLEILSLRFVKIKSVSDSSEVQVLSSSGGEAENSAEDEIQDMDEITKCLRLIEERLQATLLSLIKAYSSSKKGSSQTVQFCKKLFSLTLRPKSKSEPPTPPMLATVFSEIHELIQKEDFLSDKGSSKR